MSHDLLASVTEAALAIDISARGSEFDKAIQRYVTLMTSVPDYGPSALSPDDATALVMMAEDVIRRIEARLSTSDDREGLQEDLARSVYAIRAALEQIYIWRTHYKI